MTRLYKVVLLAGLVTIGGCTISKEFRYGQVYQFDETLSSALVGCDVYVNDSDIAAISFQTSSLSSTIMHQQTFYKKDSAIYIEGTKLNKAMRNTSRHMTCVEASMLQRQVRAYINVLD